MSKKNQVPRGEESRVLGDIRKALPDLWDGDTQLITVTRRGGRLKVEPVPRPCRTLDIRRVD